MVAPPEVTAFDPAAGAGLPPSPTPRRTQRPRWLDLRLVLGVALVLASVLLGAVVVSRASADTAVWSVTRALPAGAVLAADDLAAVRVRLGDAEDRYVPADRAVVGSRLRTDLGAGQLLPGAALGTAADDASLVTVSVPFAAADAPTIVRGDRITVWLSTPTCSSVVLLPVVAVQDVRDDRTGLRAADGLQVVVTVSPDLADRVVGALALDDVTLRAGVLSGGTAPSTGALPDLTACGATDPGAGSGAGSGGGSAASPTPTPTAS